MGLAQSRITSEYSWVPTSSAVPSTRKNRVCRLHGGLSSGPSSLEGRKRCGIAKTVLGGETRAIRAARPAKMAELRELARLIKGW